MPRGTEWGGFLRRSWCGMPRPHRAQHRCDRNGHLAIGKCGSQTAPVAAAEWQVLERCRIVLEEAVGIETVRIMPDIAIEMYCGYRDSDDVAGRELNTPNRSRFDELAQHDRHRRVVQDSKIR